MSNSDSSPELSSPKALKSWDRGVAYMPKKPRHANTVKRWQSLAPVGGARSSLINEGFQLPPLL